MTKNIYASTAVLILLLVSFSFKLALGIGSASDEKQLTELNKKAVEIATESPQKAISMANQALKLAAELQNKKETGTALKTLGIAHYQLTNYRQALEYYEQSLAIFKQINDYEGIASNQNNIALILERQGDYSGALKRYLESASIFSKNNNEKKLSTILGNIGEFFNTLGRFDKALDYMRQSLEIDEKNKDSLKMARSYNTIGNIYLSMKDFKTAITYYRKAEKINKSFNSQENLSTNYNNLGAAFQGLGKNNEALDYYRISIELCRQFNDHQGIIICLLNIGDINMAEGNLPQAMINLKEAQRLSNSVNDKSLNVSVLTSLANLRIKLNDPDEAITLLNEALPFAEKTGSNILLMEVYEKLSAAWKQKGDYKRSLDFLTKYRTYSDSIYNTDNSEKLNRLRVTFESEQTERDNQFLRQQNIFSQLALKRQQTIRNLLIIISIIVIVFASFVFSLYQGKKRKNELLAERNEQISKQKEELNQLYKEQFKLNETKNKFFSIIAHDLKSPFQSILGFSELLSSEYEYLSETQRREAATNILSVSNDTYRLIENLLEWGRTQTGSARAIFRAFNISEMVYETIPIFQSQLRKKNIAITYDLPPLLQAWADIDMTMAVLRNLISNAIKFTPSGGKIHVQALQSDGMVKISVKDTGNGIPPEILENLFTFDPKVQRTGTMGERGTGLGLALCLEFMELNHGIIKVESEIDKGSTFTMLLQPLRKVPLN